MYRLPPSFVATFKYSAYLVDDTNVHIFSKVGHSRDDWRLSTRIAKITKPECEESDFQVRTKSGSVYELHNYDESYQANALMLNTMFGIEHPKRVRHLSKEDFFKLANTRKEVA